MSDNDLKKQNPKFVEARTRLHEARRQEAALAFDLMVEFVKMRQGDVSSEEVGTLFRSFGMPYPATLYIAAREKAGVPLKKLLNKHSGSKSRKKDLKAQFKFLLDTTPDDKRPRYVESREEIVLTAEDKPEPAGTTPEEPRFVSAVMTVPPPAFNIQTVSTEALITELNRREREATDLLRTLGKLPPEREPTPPSVDPK